MGAKLKSICFFNNKGGVGKTTLTCNVAAQFAAKGHRVLVVDGDPQCNATQLILGDSKVLQLYWPTQQEPITHSQTILDVVQPMQDGDANTKTDVTFVSKADNRFGVDLLPGHPRFSVIEDKLSQGWQDLRGGSLGGIRKNNWCHLLFSQISQDYDYAFIDIGPSLGSINRSILLAADYFATPIGADVFSILGLRNISDWLTDWIKAYKSGVEICEKEAPGKAESFNLIMEPKIGRGYVGYTLQQYLTKSTQGVRRPTVAFERILKAVPNQLEAHLKKFLPPSLNLQSAKLGDVPNMFSLIPLAQSVNAPIPELAYPDGLVGSQYKQASEYAAILKSVATSLENNLSVEDSAAQW